MEDLVDDSLGISFQFGIHGAALLRLGGFLQILVFNRDDQINRLPLTLDPIERFWASRTFAEGPFPGIRCGDDRRRVPWRNEQKAWRPARSLADRGTPSGARADISRRLAGRTV
jgi:hypothetical protein